MCEYFSFFAHAISIHHCLASLSISVSEVIVGQNERIILSSFTAVYAF